MSRRNRRRKGRKAEGAAALRPQAPQAPPGYRSGPGLSILPTRQAGVRVNEDTALTLGAVFACIRVISEDMAKLSWCVYKKLRPLGRLAQPDHRVEWLIDFQPNPETPAFQFRETLMGHALGWGNGYAEIERDAAGRPLWLWQLTPDRVIPVRTRQGMMYEVINPREPNTVLEASDVFHLRGFGFDGLLGYNIIRLGARAIGLGIALEEAAANFSANDSTPGGVLQHPGRLTEAAARNLRESWNRRHGGPYHRRTVAVLEEGLKWEQTGIDPDSGQLIEQRQFTPQDICRLFRVPPHKIADLAKASYNSLENQSMDYVADALLPWAKRLEGEANIKLFGQQQRGSYCTRFNFTSLLRGDSVARGTYYKDMVDRGIFSINDVLDLEDRNPIGPDGDKRFIPLNMQPLDGPAAGAEPDADDSTSGGLLEVPDCRQTTTYTCGACATAAVCAYFGREPSTEAAAVEALGTTEETSTLPSHILDILIHQARLSACATQDMTIDDLRCLTGCGKPVICPIKDYNYVPGGTGEQTPKNEWEGHYIVVIGVAFGYVFCQDSSHDNVTAGSGSEESPGKVMISEQRFLEIWHDTDYNDLTYMRYGIAVCDEIDQPPEAKAEEAAKDDKTGSAPAPGKQEPPKPEAQSDPRNKGGGVDVGGLAAQNLLLPLLTEACERVRRRWEHRKPDADKRPEFRAEHRTYAEGALAPVALAFAEMIGGADAAARLALAIYVEAQTALDNPTWPAAELADAVLAACAATNARRNRAG